MPSVLDSTLAAASAVGDHVRTISTLTRNGVLRPMRPDKLLRIAKAFRNWSVGLPLAYAVGAARHPDRPAIIDDHGVLSYAEVEQRTTRLANGLRRLDIGPGSRVGVLCRNHHGQIEAMVGSGKSGADTVLVNTGLSRDQLTTVAQQQGIDLLVADEEFLPALADLPKSTRRIVAWHDGVTDETTLERLITGSPAAGLPRRPGGRIIVLTSGTTGAPKGARRPEPPGLSPAATMFSRVPLQEGERALVCAPLFHTLGFGGFQLSCVLGATVVLRRRFDPEEALADAQRHRCTSMFVVPVMLQRLLDLPERTREHYDHSSLRVVCCAGSAIPPRVATSALRELGPVLYNLYGTTEVSWATIATPEELRDAPTTAGRTPRGTRLAILDDQDHPVPTGTTGRIHVANEMLFEGYTNGSTRELANGLMPTGDVGHLDEAGRLYVVGRDDDMIVSGGENLYPKEVEDVITALPDVREAVVTGVADEEFGQRLAAYVVQHQADGTEPLDADAVREHVRERLARFSVPRDVVFLDELPRNATGKVLTRELPSST